MKNIFIFLIISILMVFSVYGFSTSTLGNVIVRGQLNVSNSTETSYINGGLVISKTTRINVTSCSTGVGTDLYGNLICTAYTSGDGNISIVGNKITLAKLSLGQFTNDLNWVTDTTIQGWIGGNSTLDRGYTDTRVDSMVNASSGNNITVYNLTAESIKGNLSWSYLYDYPSTCSDGYAVTEMGDSNICTQFTEYQFGSNNFNGSGDFTTIGNITAPYYCNTTDCYTVSDFLVDIDTTYTADEGNLTLVGTVFHLLQINLAELDNSVSAFITNTVSDLVNYYTKTEIDTYISSNKTDTETKLGDNIDKNITEVNSRVLNTTTDFGGDVSGTYNVIAITKNYNTSTEIAKVKVDNATNADTLAGSLPSVYLDNTDYCSGGICTGNLTISGSGANLHFDVVNSSIGKIWMD